MCNSLKRLALALMAAFITACGGSSTETDTASTSTARGTLVQSPPFRIVSVNSAAFLAQLSGTSTGAQLLEITGNPVCGVDVYQIDFWTVGGVGEATESSGALMVPTGAGAPCSGPRPIVEYAHGTNANQALNIADVTDTSNTEGILIAAMFAAQGYIVVAPNYAGYDISTLGYHPFVNAVQQSSEMIDILAAARTALPTTFASATSDDGQLFLTGYSEGGYVAMATLRAMQAAGEKVTAAAPMSGPYALEAFGDAIFFGAVDLGSTEFAPLLVNSYQHAYSYVVTTDIAVFSSFFPNAQTTLPSTTPIDSIYSQGLLPETALFNRMTPQAGALTPLLAVPPTPALPASAQTPIFDLGFGSPYLLTNDFRVSYAADAAGNPDGAVPTPTAGVPLAKTKPTQGLRQDFYVNDLRNGDWAPASPTLLCGGDLDPTVFFDINTGTIAAFWAAAGVPSELVTVLDVNATPAGAFAAIQTAFQASGAAELAYLQSAAGGGLTLGQAEQQLIANYHVSVAPFCTLAARNFFSQF